MKYSYEEKLAAVLSVVRGQHSVSSASKHFGISYTPLSRWIARYKEFGEAGLRIRQYTYSGDFKLSAIRHMHENHLSLTETTAKFGIYNEFGKEPVLYEKPLDVELTKRGVKFVVPACSVVTVRVY